MAGAPSAVRTPQPRPQVYWIPPPNDTYKINLMGQFLRMQIKKGLELLLGIIKAWWLNQCLRRFPSQIQLMILKPCKGSWILYGFRNLKGNFRGDSMVIINSLQDEVSSLLALFGHLIVETKIFSGMFYFYEFFSYTPSR